MTAAFARSRFSRLAAFVVAATAAIALWLYHVALPEAPPIASPSPLPAAAAEWQRIAFYERFDEAQLRALQRVRAKDTALSAEVLVLVAAAIAACFPYFVGTRPHE